MFEYGFKQTFEYFGKYFSKYLNIILILFLLLSLSHCASTQDPAELFKGQTDQQIYTQAQKALAKQDYNQAIQAYEALDDLYPFSPYAEPAMLDSITAYYAIDDNATAAATASRFIHVYPANPKVDYAYYMKGMADMIQTQTFSQKHLPIDLATRDLESAKQAYNDFMILTQKFPHSIYTPKAKLQIIYLHHLFTQHELAIAKFYYTRHAVVASANRASAVLKNNPDNLEALNIYKQSMEKILK